MTGVQGDFLSDREIYDKFQTAVASLLAAYRYAEDTNCSPWDFAVEVSRLRDLGLSNSELRWLVQKGFVEHAREITVPGEDGRQFQPTGNLTFTKRTCFVLTEAGVAHANLSHGQLAFFCKAVRDSAGCGVQATPAGPLVANGRTPRPGKPHWDVDTRELRIAGKLVKRFKWPAVNQETVLAVFQEEDWPHHIDDPLPPQPEQDPKGRLSDTIKCLNRKQQHALIHFRGDGTGEGVIWERTGQD